MPSKYDLGYEAGMAKAMPAVLGVLDRLADARRDSAEWKEQHENLLAMFRASEQRAAEQTARADASEKDARRIAKLREYLNSQPSANTTLNVCWIQEIIK